MHHKIVLLCIRMLFCVLGAIFINSSFDNYHKKRYGCLGLDLMIIFMMCVYIVQIKLMIL